MSMHAREAIGAVQQRGHDAATCMCAACRVIRRRAAIAQDPRPQTTRGENPSVAPSAGNAPIHFPPEPSGAGLEKLDPEKLGG